MMTKSTSQKIAILKKLSIFPILAGLIYFFCIEVVAKEKKISVNQDAVSAEAINTVELDNSPLSDKRRDTYYSGVYVKIKDVRKDTTIKINKMYENLTLKEKRHYLNWVPNKINPKKITADLFSKLSNSKKEAVWVDGKAINNSDLKKLKPSDFKYYTRRFIDKKVRLKQFPQEYQYTLFTNAYFDKNLKDSHVKYEHDTLKTGMIEYQEAKRRYPNKFSTNSQEKNSTVTEASYFKGVRFIFRDGNQSGKIIIDKLYDELTTAEKEKFKLFLKNGIPKPYQKMSPTQKEMEDFKNSKKYAIWIDGKPVPNEKLSQYKPNEIAHFSGSAILKNARSKRFPQPFQYWFSTHKYFEDTKMGVQKTKYAGDKVEVWHENKSKSNKKENDSLKKSKYGFISKEILINNEKCVHVIKDNGEEKYYNSNGFQINKNGEILKFYIDLEKVGEQKIINGKKYYFTNSTTIDGKQIVKGYLEKDNQTIFYNKFGNETTYYTKWGKRCDKDGNIL